MFKGTEKIEVLNYTNSDTYFKYEGQIIEGKPQGRGNMTFIDGGFYSGDWQDGRRHGEGNQIYSKDSERYSYGGSWVYDQEDGSGIVKLMKETFKKD